MKEKQFQTGFLRLLRARKKTGAYELKVSRGKKFYFSQVREHQIHALRAAKHALLAHKISDSALGYKPCDYLSIAGGEAYIVIRFPSGKIKWIDIDDFLALRKKKKSIDENAP